MNREQKGGVTILENTTFANGDHLLTLKLPDTKTNVTSVHIQFWNRQKNGSDKSDGHQPDSNSNSNTNTNANAKPNLDLDLDLDFDCTAWTASKWQSYVVDTIGQDIVNNTCGFSKLLDFHYRCGSVS